VAVDAESHLKIDLFEAVEGLHVAVAIDAIELSPFQVGDMVKEYEVGHPEYPYPGNRRAGAEIALLVFDLRMVRDDVFVAEKAFRNRWQARIGGALHIGMAEAAVDLLYPCMDPVAEGDGLQRPDISLGIMVEIEEGKKERSERDEPQVSAPWLAHGTCPTKAALFRVCGHGESLSSFVSAHFLKSGSETGCKGTLLRNAIRQSPTTPRKPAVISASVAPRGISFPFHREGATSMNFSSHMPARIMRLKINMGSLLVFTDLLRRTKKGMRKIMKRATHASGSHGVSFTRRIT
jgi:hypothetical protein